MNDTDNNNKLTPFFIVVLIVFFLSGLGVLAGIIVTPGTGTFGSAVGFGVFGVLCLISGMIAGRKAGLSTNSIILLGIIVGLFLGIAAGVNLEADAATYGWLGNIFLNGLKMIIVPLVVASIIVGVTNLGDVRKLGRMGSGTLAYYVATTAISVTIGLIMVNLIQPGVGVELTAKGIPEVVKGRESLTTTQVLIDVVEGMIPANLFKAAADMDILPLIVFSILFAVVLTIIGSSGKPVIDFFRGLNDAIMKLVRLIMWYAPVGVFGLVAGIIGDQGGWSAFWEQAVKVLYFCVTVIVGLGIHGLIVLPLVLILVANRNPLTYMNNMLHAFMTALSTDSSSATLPVTMECVRDKNNVGEEASDLVLPLGATINMDGTALYEACAAIFIAQIYGIDLGLGQQVVVFLTATLAAVGAAGIPHAGLVTMVLVLKSVGLPLEGIALLLAVDWFLDRCRTTVNVFGDSVGAAVIDRWAGSSATD